jgi:hypothetical protein
MSYFFFENRDTEIPFNDAAYFSSLIGNENNELDLNIEDDRRNFPNNANITQFLNMNVYDNFEIRTDATLKRPFYNSPLKELIKKDDAHPFYSINTIRDILIQNNDYNNRLTDKIIKEKSVIEAEEYMKSGKKINSDDFMYQSDNIFNQENFINWEYEEVKEKNNYLKIKRGRKTERNDGGEHNRYDADNIMKKIKAKLIDYCIKFINIMIFKNNEERIQILKIDYKYIDQLNKKKNLDLLEMPLLDFLSLDASGKYKSKSKDYNAKLLNEILEQKFEIEDFDTIMFLLKITLNDWIDLFTYKKDILTLIDEYNCLNVNDTKIKNNFIGVNHLLNEISKENNDKYYSLFLLYVFNFQRWFYIKKGRNRKK